MDHLVDFLDGEAEVSSLEPGVPIGFKHGLVVNSLVEVITPYNLRVLLSDILALLVHGFVELLPSFLLLRCVSDLLW